MDRVDLVVLGAADIGHEPDDAGVAVDPRFQRPRAQTAGKSCRQHADARLLDNIPDAGDVVLIRHVTDTLMLPHRSSLSFLFPLRQRRPAI